jgi:hypothetical protein
MILMNGVYIYGRKNNRNERARRDWWKNSDLYLYLWKLSILSISYNSSDQRNWNLNSSLQQEIVFLYCSCNWIALRQARCDKIWFLSILDDSLEQFWTLIAVYSTKASFSIALSLRSVILFVAEYFRYQQVLCQHGLQEPESEMNNSQQNNCKIVNKIEFSYSIALFPVSFLISSPLDASISTHLSD